MPDEEEVAARAGDGDVEAVVIPSCIGGSFE